MQVAYQPQVSDTKNVIGTTSPRLLPSMAHVSQTSQATQKQDLLTVKTENENYNFKRIYSPFLSPSNIIVSDKVSMSNALEAKFVHNEARTKYFFVSKPAKITDHLKINLLA